MHTKGVTQEAYEADFKSLTVAPTSPNPAAALKQKLKREEG
jgi:hypothetical protein